MIEIVHLPTSVAGPFQVYDGYDYDAIGQTPLGIFFNRADAELFVRAKERQKLWEASQTYTQISKEELIAKVREAFNHTELLPLMLEEEGPPKPIEETEISRLVAETLKMLPPLKFTDISKGMKEKIGEMVPAGGRLSFKSNPGVFVANETDSHIVVTSFGFRSEKEPDPQPDIVLPHVENILDIEPTGDGTKTNYKSIQEVLDSPSYSPKAKKMLIDNCTQPDIVIDSEPSYWCAPCGSFHPSPMTLEQHAELKCKSTWKDFGIEGGK